MYYYTFSNEKLLQNYFFFFDMRKFFRLFYLHMCKKSSTFAAEYTLYASLL